MFSATVYFKAPHLKAIEATASYGECEIVRRHDGDNVRLDRERIEELTAIVKADPYAGHGRPTVIRVTDTGYHMPALPLEYNQWREIRGLTVFK